VTSSLKSTVATKAEFVYVTYIQTTAEEAWKALTQGDINNGKVDNTATVNGTDTNNQPVTKTADESVPVPQVSERASVPNWPQPVKALRQRCHSSPCSIVAARCFRKRRWTRQRPTRLVRTLERRRPLHFRGSDSRPLARRLGQGRFSVSRRLERWPLARRP